MYLELDKNRNSVPESNDVFLFCSSAIDWEGYMIMEKIVGKFYKFESHKFENKFLIFGSTIHRKTSLYYDLLCILWRWWWRPTPDSVSSYVIPSCLIHFKVLYV